MEQIRELMFGGVARDFDRRLKEMEERFAEDLARICKDGDKRIAVLEARLNTQIERLQAQLRQEAAARALALDGLEMRMSQALVTQRSEVNAVLQRHEDEAVAGESRFGQALGAIEAQARESVQALKATLNSSHAHINESKLAREDMADMMAELSLRLRGPRDSAVEG
ncbi:hypothetical protein [Pseudomonas sp. CGJS7]|uniref:hypothetical protein n=1 Tax=Pseudomonas sp. CGJS7 TaxID=3109348 RepID=UPI003009841D